MIDFKALGAKAAAEGKDMTQATTGGGDYTPPPEGPCRLRFVGYVETGKQKGTFKGVPNVKPKVELTFEVSGKAYPPTEVDGVMKPLLITCELDYSLNEKSHFFKLFTRLNYTQVAKHIAELLGGAYKGVIHHEKWEKNGKEYTKAVLRSKADGYTIAPPRIEDDEAEGGYRTMEVAPATTPIKCFLWEYADLAQWATIFIDGAYPERKDDKGNVTAPAKSKNVIQNRIKSATNFVGSPIHSILLAAGGNVDIPEAESGEEALGNGGATGTTGGAAASSTISPSEQVAKMAASTDALAGIV